VFGQDRCFVSFCVNASAVENEKWKMSTTSKNEILDIRDYFSPLSVLKVRSLLNNLKDGQMLEVWSNDSETKDVLERIIRNSNDELVGIKKQSEYEKIYIRRRKNRTTFGPV
jgi:TusA-related sulfurtransferase